MTIETPAPQNRIEYQSETDTYRVLYSPETESPSEIVVMATEVITNRRFSDLGMLYDAINPDALDSMFQATTNGSLSGEQKVEFPYSGHTVCVQGSGVITLQPAHNSSI